MEVIIFEKETFYKMHRELAGMFKQAIKDAKVEALQQTSPENDWLPADQAKQLLGIRSKTKLQELRDQDAIKFSQHGRIIKYSKKSILEFLEKNSTR